jgi:hypothetical protein
MIIFHNFNCFAGVLEPKAMRTVRTFALSACAFVCLAVQARAAQISFAVSNTTSVAVVSIELRSPDQPDIQPPITLAANVATGAQQEFTADVAEGACLFAAVFVMADGSQRERNDLDLCEYAIIAIE